MKNKKPRRARPYDETICLQRDSLDLYVDDVLTATAPISYNGMQCLKAKADDLLHSGVLFQIKIRNSVQWESRPTVIEDEPTGFNYESSVL